LYDYAVAALVTELRKYLRREAAGRSGYLDDRQIEAIHDIAAQVLPRRT